jgi:hypothetical protein
LHDNIESAKTSEVSLTVLAIICEGKQLREHLAASWFGAAKPGRRLLLKILAGLEIAAHQFLAVRFRACSGSEF